MIRDPPRLTRSNPPFPNPPPFRSPSAGPAPFGHDRSPRHCRRALLPMPWEASEVEDHAGRGPEAVEIIGFGLEAQADAAISGDAAQADVLGADFHAQAVHPVLAVRPADRKSKRLNSSH